MTRHGISSPDARTTTPRRSRRDPRRAIRGRQSAAQVVRRGRRRSRRRVCPRIARPADRRSRPERWADAVQTLADMLDQFQEWRDNLPSSLETARQRKRSTPYWSCAVMLKISRRSRCQKASDGTDGAHQWHCETRFLCVQRIDPASRGPRSEALRQSKGTGLAASGPST